MHETVEMSKSLPPEVPIHLQPPDPIPPNDTKEPEQKHVDVVMHQTVETSQRLPPEVPIHLQPPDPMPLKETKEPEQKHIDVATDQSIVPDKPSVREVGITEIKQGDGCWLKCSRVTRIALFALLTIAIIGATLVGILATMGGHASWTPNFMVTLSDALGPSYIPYIMTASGPAYLLIVGIGLLIRKKWYPVS